MNRQNITIDLTKTKLEWNDGINIGNIYYSPKSDRLKIVIFRIDDKCYCLYYHKEKDKLTSCSSLTVLNILKTHHLVGKIVLPIINGHLDLDQIKIVEELKKDKSTYDYRK